MSYYTESDNAPRKENMERNHAHASFYLEGDIYTSIMTLSDSTPHLFMSGDGVNLSINFSEINLRRLTDKLNAYLADLDEARALSQFDAARDSELVDETN